MKKKRRLNSTSLERAEILTEYRRSGLPPSIFAREKGLSPNLLRKWVQRYDGILPTQAGDPLWQPVSLEEVLGTQSPWVAELTLPGGALLRLSARADGTLINQLCQYLRVC